MSQFKDRQKSQEAKYAMDDEKKFRVLAKASGKLGLWAGEKLGKTGEELQAYKQAAVSAGISGEQSLIAKVMADLAVKGEISESEVMNVYASKRAEAEREIISEE